jgi:hypothetical protein
LVARVVEDKFGFPVLLRNRQVGLHVDRTEWDPVSRDSEAEGKVIAEEEEHGQGNEKKQAALKNVFQSGYSLFLPI